MSNAEVALDDKAIGTGPLASWPTATGVGTVSLAVSHPRLKGDSVELTIG